MTKHIHAELMLQYAQDAMETDKPWERWECCRSDGVWDELSKHPMWTERMGYRRKPRTININGFEVPEPVREPLEEGTTYFVPNLHGVLPDPHYESIWDNCGIDVRRLVHGLIHLTREAAELHAKALLSFTEKKA